MQEQPLLVLKGAAGSGKSALLSAIAMKLRQLGQDAVPYISCLTLQSSSALSLVKSMCRELEKRLSFVSPDTEFQEEKEWLQYLESLCREMNAAAVSPVYFLIDAADQLFPDGLSDELAFIPKTLGDNVRMVVTCLTGFSAGVHAYETLQPMNRDEQEEIIAGMLSSRRREISREVIRKMLEKTSADNPLYLTLLLTRLLLMNRDDFSSIVQSGDGMDAITEYQCQIVEKAPEELGSLAAAVFSVAAERVNKELIEKISGLLAVSRSGLRMADLQAVLPDTFNTLDFIHFVHYMSDSFIQREDGRFDFMHKSMREGILAQCGDTQALHAELAAGFEREPEEDPVRRTEMIYHVLMTRDTEKFLRYLSSTLDPEAEDEHRASEEQKKLLESAARRVYEVCRSDEGAYYLSILNQAEKLPERGALVRFTGLYLYPQFPSGKHDNRILGRILEKNFDLMQRTAGVGIRVLSRSCWYLGKTITYVDTGEEAAEAARSCYEKARQYLNIIPKDRFTPEDYHLLGLFWYEKGRTYDDQSLFNSGNDAIHCFEKAEEAFMEAAEDEEQREEREIDRAYCFIRMGEASSGTGGSLYSDQKKALSYYEKGRSIQKELFERKDSDRIRRNLIYSGKSLAECRLNMGGLENNREALRLLEENVELARKLYEDQKDLRNLRRLRDVLNDLTEVLARSYELPHRIRALVVLREQYQLNLRIAQESGNYYPCADVLHRVSGILADMKSTQAHLYALGFLDASDELLRLHGDLPYCSDPTEHFYWKIRGDVYSSLGMKEKAEKCYAVRNKCLADSGTGAFEAAYAELLEIIDILGTDYLYKVPVNLFNIFRGFASTDYVRHLDPDVPLDKQDMAEITRTLIAIMLVGYWAVDEEEQKSLLAMYESNEEELQRINPAAQDSAERKKAARRNVSFFFIEDEQHSTADQEHFPVRPSCPGILQDPFLQAPSADELETGLACMNGEGWAYRPDYAEDFFSRAAARGSAKACEEMINVLWKTRKNPDVSRLYAWRNLKDLVSEKNTETDAVQVSAGGKKTVYAAPTVENVFSMLFAAPFARNYQEIAEETGRALRGDALAECALAERYRAGETPFDGPDKKMAIGYWKSAMEKGCIEAEYSYANYCVFEKKVKLRKEDYGFAMLKELAARGNLKAQIRLAELRYRNDSVLDVPQAQAMLEKAAAEESVEALYHLGALYSHEKSGELRDLDRSISLLSDAAERGHAEAARLLGDLYKDETLPLCDPEKALAWYEKGAVLGSINAAVGAFKLHLEQKGQLRHDLAMLLYQEQIYQKKPAESGLNNLTLFYGGYETLPYNPGMWIYYRLFKDASDLSVLSSKESMWEKLKGLHQRDSRNIRYFLQETQEERTDYDAMKTQDYSFGEFVFRIPESYDCLLKPVTQRREIREDAMIFTGAVRSDGHSARLEITQKEAESDQLAALTAEAGKTGKWSKVYLAQDIPAVYSTAVSETEEGEREHIRRIDTLIPGAEKDKPFHLQMTMTYTEPAGESSAGTQPWSSGDDFICIVDAVRKRSGMVE